ncbi:MAG: hypothetical protein HC901_03380 [Bdellovibrionaceae bacterium]|nr:hypothetical protein [Pseudobdellovibrionaceae bacterium]
MPWPSTSNGKPKLAAAFTSKSQIAAALRGLGGIVVTPGEADNTAAARPVMTGVAMDVPLSIA